jgi:hypothetical protein
MLASVIACCASLILEAALIASFASPIGPVPHKAGLRACVAAMCLYRLTNILHIAMRTKI